MVRERPESRVLSDKDLVTRVKWPRGLTAEEIRGRIAAACRFIDFDETLVVGGRVRDPFCGKSLASFLGEQPFLIQTWGPEGAVSFFRRRPELPQPLLIVDPPGIRVRLAELWFDPHEIDPDFCGDAWVWKDLLALGIAQGEVYDDSPHHVWAPGCTVIPPFR